MDILDKLDVIVNEEAEGTRPIQFMKFYKDFRPGDRADVIINDMYISIVGSDAQGNFAGVKKSVSFDDNMEMDEFKNSRRDIWDFI